MAKRPREEPRADGPAVVGSGDPKRPGVLVLDPAGAGKHGEPPASWRELDEEAHVTWLRLPAMDTAVATARETLAELTAGGRRVHLLAGGEAAPLAELLALERPDALSSVLLVDPPSRETGELMDTGTTVVEQALLKQRTAPTESVLAGHGVALYVITYQEADRADRGAPLPLGHPEVVAAVRRTLADEPAETAEPAQPAEPIAAEPVRPRDTTGEPGRLDRLWRRLRGLLRRSGS